MNTLFFIWTKTFNFMKNTNFKEFSIAFVNSLVNRLSYLKEMENKSFKYFGMGIRKGIK